MKYFNVPGGVLHPGIISTLKDPRDVWCCAYEAQWNKGMPNTKDVIRMFAEVLPALNLNLDRCSQNFARPLQSLLGAS